MPKSQATRATKECVGRIVLAGIALIFYDRVIKCHDIQADVSEKPPMS